MKQTKFKKQTQFNLSDSLGADVQKKENNRYAKEGECILGCVVERKTRQGRSLRKRGVGVGSHLKGPWERSCWPAVFHAYARESLKSVVFPYLVFGGPEGSSTLESTIGT